MFMKRGRNDEVLLVCAVTVRRVVGVLATTQPNGAVFLRGKAQRGQALGFELVGSIAERLKDKEVVRKPVGGVLQTGITEDGGKGGTNLLLAVSTGAPRVTLSTQQLHSERLLRGDDGLWREGGQLWREEKHIRDN